MTVPGHTLRCFKSIDSAAPSCPHASRRATTTESRRRRVPWMLLALAIALGMSASAASSEAFAATSINARNHGMVGDNTTDNSAALARACKAGVARGLPVFIPGGRYRLATPVTLPAGVKLRGAGGFNSAATGPRFKGTWLRGAVRFSSNVKVTDMKIGDGLGMRSVGPASRTTSNVRFARVRFRGGGGGHAVFVVDAQSVDGLALVGCRFECNLGPWQPGGGGGNLWFGVDTSMGTVIRNVTIRGCHFGVSNGVRTGSPTYNIVFWQSEEAGSGWWGDILIERNVFERTDEFNLDFDGLELRDNGHNDVVIRGNLIKGAGARLADGAPPKWAYTICTEPTRRGTVIEGNTLLRGFYSVFKTTKDTTDTVFRDNLIDLTAANGVELYYEDFFRTVNLYDGARNRVTGNTIHVPAGVPVSPNLIDDNESDSVISGNRIVGK